MNWLLYEVKFREKAKTEKLDSEIIESNLLYAKNLSDRGLPIIYDQTHLSLLLGHKLETLIAMSNNSNNINVEKKYYRCFSIEKKSGGSRTIHEPLPSLKEIQKWIHTLILKKSPLNETAVGFRENLGTKDGAKIHVNKNKVLKMDIKDFFPSTSSKKVYLAFRKMGYVKDVSILLRGLCTLNHGLPQGAPTSPLLSNIVNGHLDLRISNFAKGLEASYSRYADDITLSGDFFTSRVIHMITKIVEDEGYFINTKKTRLMERHQSQRVTGVVVNVQLNSPREMRKYVRQNIYYIKKYGLTSHLKKINVTKSGYLNHLLGKCNYILGIDPTNKEINDIRKYIFDYLTS